MRGILHSDAATHHARRLGQSRRTFLVSACGAATTLLGMNTAYGAAGRRGGYFELDADAALDLQLARSTARYRRVHFRRARPFRESDRRLDEAIAAGRATVALRHRSRELQLADRTGLGLAALPRFRTLSSRTSFSIRTPTSSCCRSCRRRAKASR